ncbi:hypothetical protein TA3x_001082 [Tundrisphaera sp. TA3]|uniref:hypothetical protein n=1 Tax=Tundrisphaera sp. TA3 TaxID=3435775 RepID=UPI003EBF2CE5
MGEAKKRYEYPTGNLEMMIRAKAGEPFEVVMADIAAKWRPGNEHLWDDYDAESLVDTDEKRQYMVNQLIYSRIRVFRELKSRGFDTQGGDPFDHVDRTPELLDQLRDRFPHTIGSRWGNAPA